MVGLLKFVLELRGFANEKQLKLLLDIMAWAERNKLNETYAAEFGTLKEHFDNALAAAWMNVKGDVKRRIWWDLNRPLAALAISDPDAITRLLKVQGEWVDHADLVNEVVLSSRLGASMFDFALLQALCSKVSRSIQSSVDSLLRDGDVDEKAIEQTKQSCATAFSTLALEKVPAKREISLCYRKLNLKIIVTSVAHEVELRIAATLKERAVDHGLLPPLWVEKEVSAATVVAAGAKLDIPDRMLRSWMAAREMCDSIGRKAPHEQITSFLNAKKLQLQQLDASFDVEVGFWTSFKSASAEQACLAKLLACLPDAAAAATADRCQQQLRDLAKTPLCTFCGKGMESIVKEADEMLSAILSGIPPSWDERAISNASFKAVIDKLGNLCAFGQLRGGAAAKAKYDEVSKMSAEKWKSATLKDLETLLVYGWLLTKEQRVKVQEWSTSLKRNVAKTASSSTVPREKVAKGEKRKRSSKDKSSVEKCVKDLFKN